MVKSKFTMPDVRAMIKDLRVSILGQKCINIYDLDSKTYIFKLGVSGVSEKVTLLMESGMRFHTTSFIRDRESSSSSKKRGSLTSSSGGSAASLNLPNGFCMKLRKHIRGKTLEDIQQVNGDRVVLFRFGSAEYANYIILELYASGNIILTDSKYEILNVLRTHSYGDGVQVAVRSIYPVTYATSERKNAENKMTAEVLYEFIVNKLTAQENNGGMGIGMGEPPMIVGEGKPKKQKRKKQKKITLKLVLLANEIPISTYGPQIVEHCILSAGLSPTKKLTLEDFILTDAAKLVESFHQVEPMIQELDEAGEPGYISMRKSTSNTTTEDKEMEEEIFYEEFFPLLLRQYHGAHVESSEKNEQSSRQNGDQQNWHSISSSTSSSTIIKDHITTSSSSLHNDNQQIADQDLLIRSFPSFNAAVDDFFAKIETQKIRQEILTAEVQANNKIEWMQKSQAKRQRALEEEEKLLEKQAYLVQVHAESIDKVLLVINSAIATGADWDSLDDYIKNEQANGNPLARLILQLKLETNQLTLILKDPYYELDTVIEEEDNYDDENEDDDEEESETEESREGRKKREKEEENHEEDEEDDRENVMLNAEYVEVDIDINLSAHANSTKLYEEKKKVGVKAAKTAHGSTKALKAIEIEVQSQLQKQQQKRTIHNKRRIFWFEKFNWFITSENFLVLSGRDAQQNEQLVKKYLRKDDIYIHADVYGASSCILRNKMGRKYTEISLQAIEEAGHYCACHSTAWKQKAPTPVWYVYTHQVSKTAPTGEYLSTGSFMIRGKKNYLRPSMLEMGFSVLFFISSDSVENHQGERREYGSEFLIDGVRLGENGTMKELKKTELSLGEEEEKEEQGEGLDENGPDSDLDLDLDIDLGLENDDDKKSENEEEEEEEEEKEEKAEEEEEEEQEKDNDDIIENVVDKNDYSNMPEKKEKKNLSYVTPRERKLMKKYGKTVEKIRAEEEARKEKESIEKDLLNANGEDEEESGDKEDDNTKSSNQEKGSKIEKEDGKKIGKGREKGKGKKKKNFDAPTMSSTELAKMTNLNQNKRGKKGKLKKMKGKYRDQDDEDRELALMALGVIKNKKESSNNGENSSTSDEDISGDEENVRRKIIKKKLASDIEILQTREYETAWGNIPITIQQYIERMEQEKEITISDSSTGAKSNASTNTLSTAVTEKENGKSNLIKKNEGGGKKISLKILKNYRQDIGFHELSSLSQFTSEEMMIILQRFEEGICKSFLSEDARAKIRSKSGFLASIMRSFRDQQKRSQKELTTDQVSQARSTTNDHTESKGLGEEEKALETETDTGNGGKIEDRKSAKEEEEEDTIDGDTNFKSSTSNNITTNTSTSANTSTTPDNSTINMKDTKDREEEEKIGETNNDTNIEMEEVILFGDEDQTLRQLTGVPHPKDEILFALPVCAPYTSFHPNYYKYRSKLIPGAMKRGKTAKSVLTAFIHYHDNNNKPGTEKKYNQKIHNKSSSSSSSFLPLDGSKNGKTSTANHDATPSLRKGLTEEEEEQEQAKVDFEDRMNMKALEHRLLQSITDDEAIKTMIGDTRIVSTTIGIGSSKTAITTMSNKKSSSSGKGSNKKGAKNRGRKGK